MPSGDGQGQMDRFVSVVSIKVLADPLWSVTVRTAEGKRRQIVIDRRLCTTQTVAMAAHAVAMLVAKNQA